MAHASPFGDVSVLEKNWWTSSDCSNQYSGWFALRSQSHFFSNAPVIATSFAGFMTRCPSLDGSYRWAAVPMVVGITTTPTLLCVDATALFLWTSTSLAAPQLLRPYCTVFSSCKRRSTGARISFTGGRSELALWTIRFMKMQFFYVSLGHWVL